MRINSTLATTASMLCMALGMAAPAGRDVTSSARSRARRPSTGAAWPRNRLRATHWALLACTLASMPVTAAPIHELTLRAPVVFASDFSFWSYLDSLQYVRDGDVAELTVRYEAVDTPDQLPSASSALYKNVITYFSFALERAGTQTYFGEISGNFGQVVVTNDASNINTGGSYDRLDFRIRDEYRGPGGIATSNYPNGTRTGTTPAPDMLPGIDTGTVYGDLVFKNFDLHFTTADASAIADTGLSNDLGGVVFAPQIGNGIWSAGADLTADSGGVYQRGSSFGGGTPRNQDELPQIQVSFRTLSSFATVAEPDAPTVFVLGLASLMLLRVRRATHAPSGAAPG